MPRRGRGASGIEYVIALLFVAMSIIIGYRAFGKKIRCHMGIATTAMSLDGKEVDSCDDSEPLAQNGPSGNSSAGSGPAGPPPGWVCVNGLCSRPEGCFVAGTPIATEAGPLAIEAVAPGMMVLTRDQAGGDLQWRPVARVVTHPAHSLVQLTLVDGAGVADTLVATPEHPLQSQERGWIAAAELVPGRDHLLDANGELLDLVDGESLSRDVPVYNFEVEEAHTYFVGRLQVWAHNDASCLNVPPVELPPGTGGPGRPGTPPPATGDPGHPPSQPILNINTNLPPSGPGSTGGSPTPEPPTVGGTPVSTTPTGSPPDSPIGPPSVGGTPVSTTPPGSPTPATAHSYPPPIPNGTNGQILNGNGQPPRLSTPHFVIEQILTGIIILTTLGNGISDMANGHSSETGWSSFSGPITQAAAAAISLPLIGLQSKPPGGLPAAGQFFGAGQTWGNIANTGAGIIGTVGAYIPTHDDGHGNQVSDHPIVTVIGTGTSGIINVGNAIWHVKQLYQTNEFWRRLRERDRELYDHIIGTIAETLGGIQNLWNLGVLIKYFGTATTVGGQQWAQSTAGLATAVAVSWAIWNAYNVWSARWDDDHPGAGGNSAGVSGGIP